MNNELSENFYEPKRDNYYNSRNLIYLNSRKDFEIIYSSILQIVEKDIEQEYKNLQKTKNLTKEFDLFMKEFNEYIREIISIIERFLKSTEISNQTTECLISKNSMIMGIISKIFKKVKTILINQQKNKSLINEIIVQSLVLII